MACTCLHCTLGSVIQRRYPGELDAETLTTIVTALASLSGAMIAQADEHSLARFLAGVSEARQVYRAEIVRESGGLH